MDNGRDHYEDLKGWVAPPAPDNLFLSGRYVQLSALSPDQHAVALYEAFSEDKKGRIWEYLPYGPFDNFTDFYQWIADVSGGDDPYFFAIRQTHNAMISGVSCYLRITPKVGTIEVGHINFAPSLQRTRAATEAMYLMMAWAFAAGYRRYEWKCNALNLASRQAAQRLGLSYEGVFRQASIVKGHNRDTAWFAAIDKEWPDLKSCFERYLCPDNFTPTGQQKHSLSALTKEHLTAIDPLL